MGAQPCLEELTMWRTEQAWKDMGSVKGFGRRTKALRHITFYLFKTWREGKWRQGIAGGTSQPGPVGVGAGVRMGGKA